MRVSEFVYQAVKEKMQVEKLNDSQSQFIELFDTAFKMSFDSYFKKIILTQNRIDFNTKYLLKQQDYFMQNLKIPQTKDGLLFSIIPHPIMEKAQESVLKDIREMVSRRKELEDE